MKIIPDNTHANVGSLKKFHNPFVLDFFMDVFFAEKLKIMDFDVNFLFRLRFEKIEIE